MSSNILEEVRSLRKKAEQNRHCESTLSEEQANYGWFVSTFVVFGSAFSALTMMADWGQIGGAAWGPALSGAAIFLSASVFTSEMLSRHFKWTEIAKTREAKVLAWTNWIRLATEFEARAAQMDQDERDAQFKMLTEGYRDVAAMGPMIPDSRFLKFKAEHRKKVWISKELDRDTGETPEEIEQRFYSQAKEQRAKPKT